MGRNQEGQLRPVHGSKEGASFQVIILGAGGGPTEDNVTSLFVRSAESEWRKGSGILVDAGVLLAKIIKILHHQHGLPLHSEQIPTPEHRTVLGDGPFAGLKCPGLSARAVGQYIYREILHAALVTHPHLDHQAGLIINTPALEYGKEAKAIIGLENTVEAIKANMLNNTTWPNLSDETGGVGFVTYRRLPEGGNPRLGSGSGRGYVTVADGLATKCWAITHGKCPRRFSRDSLFSDEYVMEGRRMSEALQPHRALSHPRTPIKHSEGSTDPNAHFQPVDSTAFFIRNDFNNDELLIFGDLEPDSISIFPRNHVVWDDAAPKIASGNLRAIFIECSYDNSVPDQGLYGHLNPRHLIVELSSLAAKVQSYGLESPAEPPVAQPATSAPTLAVPDAISPRMKRKRPDVDVGQKASAAVTASKTVSHRSNSRKEKNSSARSRSRSANRNGSQARGLRHTTGLPLSGVTVHIIHVKDTLADGPSQQSIILRELQEGEAGNLGCLFNVVSDGQSIWV